MTSSTNRSTYIARSVSPKSRGLHVAIRNRMYETNNPIPYLVPCTGTRYLVRYLGTQSVTYHVHVRMPTTRGFLSITSHTGCSGCSEKHEKNPRQLTHDPIDGLVSQEEEGRIFLDDRRWCFAHNTSTRPNTKMKFLAYLFAFLSFSNVALADSKECEGESMARGFLALRGE
jgi:hypothetical protein